MYAAVMHLTFDPDLAPLAAAAFSSDLLPKVRRAEGFRGGIWLDPSEGSGLGLILFERAEQASEASAPDNWRAPGVTLDLVEIRRVAVAAGIAEV